MKQIDFEIVRMEAERDEAVRNANEYRARVLKFLDGMIHESQMTQALEEAHSFAPEYREQFRHAVAYIRRAFESHNYLTEAKMAGCAAVGYQLLDKMQARD